MCKHSLLSDALSGPPCSFVLFTNFQKICIVFVKKRDDTREELKHKPITSHFIYEHRTLNEAIAVFNVHVLYFQVKQIV